MSGSPPGKKCAGGATRGDSKKLSQRRQNVRLF